MKTIKGYTGLVTRCGIDDDIDALWLLAKRIFRFFSHLCSIRLGSFVASLTELSIFMMIYNTNTHTQHTYLPSILYIENKIWDESVASVSILLCGGCFVFSFRAKSLLHAILPFQSFTHFLFFFSSSLSLSLLFLPIRYRHHHRHLCCVW